jgi:hypothetical protein
MGFVSRYPAAACFLASARSPARSAISAAAWRALARRARAPRR